MTKKEYDRQRYLKNRERLIEQSRKWRSEHKEWNRARAKRYRREHPEVIARAMEKYYKKHPGLRTALARQWRAKNRERANFISLRRAHRKRANGGDFTQEEWEHLKAIFDNRCAKCGVSEVDKKLTIDHKIPVSKGGMNSIDNIQPLCMLCNQKKKDKVWFASCKVNYAV